MYKRFVIITNTEVKFFFELFIMAPEGAPWMLMARSFIAIIAVQFVSFSNCFIKFLCKLGEDAAVEQLH